MRHTPGNKPDNPGKTALSLPETGMLRAVCWRSSRKLGDRRAQRRERKIANPGKVTGIVPIANTLGDSDSVVEAIQIVITGPLWKPKTPENRGFRAVSQYHGTEYLSHFRAAMAVQDETQLLPASFPYRHVTQRYTPAVMHIDMASILPQNEKHGAGAEGSEKAPELCRNNQCRSPRRFFPRAPTQESTWKQPSHDNCG